MNDERSLATNLIHGRKDAERSLVHPIYQTVAFSVDENEDYTELNEYDAERYFYTRYSNPTIRNVEKKLAALEGGEAALLFSSGMNAITMTLLKLLKSGDTIVASRAVYGSTLHYIEDFLPNYGIQPVILSEDELYRCDEIAPEAKVVFFETPVNPRVDCLSIPQVVAAARRCGALTIIDNTFATPINQTPREFGVDLIIHSVTKYIGGHADVTAGAVITDEDLIVPLYEARKMLGGIPSPQDAFLIDRSLKSLPLRMKLHNENALQLARFFEDEAPVKEVLYPGLESSSQHEVAKQQMKGFGGMLCVDLGSLSAAQTFSESLALLRNVPHLGAAETMVCLPALTSHARFSEEQLVAAGLSPGLVRISVGLEEIDDLIADCRQALQKIANGIG
ncbi:MAG: PLP-dependent aspartate aminotransferase family protein [Chloroflexi bacterium]|nr:PLP-dependent aspartate aminotransferase family protein [Chloroflexota bacterium]